MASPRFLGVDLSTYATMTASGGTNASFPLTNLQTYFAADIWKGSSNTTQSFTIDFGAAVTCDTLVLENHNIASLVLSGCTLQGATDSGFTTGLTAAFSIISIGNPGWFEFASASKRYWRIAWTISTGTVAPQIGNMFLGSRTDMVFAYEYPAQVGDKQFQTIMTTQLDGSLKTAQAFGGRKMFQVGWKNASDTTRSAFQSFVNTVRGRLRPFYFIDVDSVVYYAHLDRDLLPVELARANTAASSDVLKFGIQTQQVS